MKPSAPLPGADFLLLGGFMTQKSMFQSIAKAAAKSLRDQADLLEKIDNPGQLNHVSGSVYHVSFVLSANATDWMNAERKAA